MVHWAPLAKHLLDDGRDRFELRHVEIEEILGCPLPAPAWIIVKCSGPTAARVDEAGTGSTSGIALHCAACQIRAMGADVARHGAKGPDAIADTPAALDPALWFYGKWGCTFCERARMAKPIHDICGGCRLKDDSGPGLALPG